MSIALFGTCRVDPTAQDRLQFVVFGVQAATSHAHVKIDDSTGMRGPALTRQKGGGAVQI
jgi:hypothetical protein